MPRTVCTKSGLAGSRSILRRSRLTCTSTARSLAAGSLPASESRGTVSPGVADKHPQHVALAVGEADHLLAAPQFAARDMEDEIAEAHQFDRRRRRRLRALEDIADAQREFARLEGLCRHNRRRRSAGPRCASRLRRARSASGSARSRSRAATWRDRSRSRPASSRRGSEGRNAGRSACARASAALSAVVTR